jgi:hypothetical protein
MYEFLYDLFFATFPFIKPRDQVNWSWFNLFLMIIIYQIVLRCILPWTSNKYLIYGVFVLQILFCFIATFDFISTLICGFYFLMCFSSMNDKLSKK